MIGFFEYVKATSITRSGFKVHSTDFERLLHAVLKYFSHLENAKYDPAKIMELLFLILVFQGTQ